MRTGISLAITQPWGGSGAAAMPSGASFIYYADQWDATKNAIPNSAVPAALSANIFRGSSRMFNTEIWTKNGCTAVDNADGSSTITAAGDWYLHQGPIALTDGTYTLAITAKRNGGSDQTFDLGNLLNSSFSSCTATSAYQRFTKTFTVSGASGQPIIISPDRATGISIDIKSFDLYAGAADLGASSPDGNLYLGVRQNVASPSVSGNLVDYTAQGCGFMQLPSTVSVSSATCVAVVEQTAAGSAFQAFISMLGGSWANFTAYAAGQSNEPRSAFGGDTQYNFAGLWGIKDQGLHMIVQNFTPTTQELWFDDICLFSKAVSAGPVNIADLVNGAVAAIGIYPGMKLNLMAMYVNANALTHDSIVRSVYPAASAKAVADGLTMATARVLVFTGDSNTAATGSWAYLYGAAASPKVVGRNFAVSGSVVADLVTDAPNVDAVLPTNINGRTFVLSVLIGTNDLATGTTAAQFLAALASYCDARRSAGWKVAVCTIQPRDDATMLAKRGAVNTEIRLWTTTGSVVPGKHADYVIDFAANADIGPDAACLDTTYYTDGIHWTAAGQAVAESVAEPVLNAIP
jgi:hypothetical protein